MFGIRGHAARQTLNQSISMKMSGYNSNNHANGNHSKYMYAVSILIMTPSILINIKLISGEHGMQ